MPGIVLRTIVLQVSINPVAVQVVTDVTLVVIVRESLLVVTDFCHELNNYYAWPIIRQGWAAILFNLIKSGSI